MKSRAVLRVKTRSYPLNLPVTRKIQQRTPTLVSTQSTRNKKNTAKNTYSRASSVVIALSSGVELHTRWMKVNRAGLMSTAVESEVEFRGLGERQCIKHDDLTQHQQWVLSEVFDL
jgi:hypothetical protein